MNDKRLLTNVVEDVTAFQRAIALQKKASEVGFDWPEINGVIAKVREELAELEHEIHTNAPPERLQDELGDLLFACANLARHLAIEPEAAISQCNQKFYRRFNYVEQRVHDQNKTLLSCNLTELDSYWEEAKQLDKQTTQTD